MVETTMTKENKEFNISIKDFQIIKKASLTFLPGLNCIIGQSNNGKSALLRATKSAIYNIAGTTSVRLGCNSYAVGIQANGHTVILQKGANSSYKIDGVVMNKIGRTQIPEVAEALKIKELNLNGSNEEINFLDQMEKPFLLDRSETELFRFIVDSGKDSNVTQALKLLTQDRQQLTRDITTTEGRLEQVGVQLKQQEENLKDADTKLSLFQSVIALGPRITRVKELTALKRALNEELEGIKELTNSNNKLNTLLDGIEPSINNINNITKKQELLDVISSNIVKSKKEKEELETKLNSISSIDDEKLKEQFNKLNSINEVIEEYNKLNESYSQLKNKVYPELKEDFGSNLDKYNLLRTIQSNIIDINNQLATYKGNLLGIESDLKNTQEEINTLGVCPMCGKPLHID